MNRTPDAHRDELRRELLAEFGPPADRAALEMRVLSRRRYADYEEWKITYDVESAATMRAEAGRKVSAYLLIPEHSPGERLPAVLCCHQCAIDCTAGKDAVVGRVQVEWSNGEARVARRDQQYGLELVREGFVVLAPDAINCGERNIPAIRKRDQATKCWGIIDDELGREAWSKRVYDEMRALDLLESLDFVDPQRIGAVGHSMGAEDVFYLMALDERVRAGIRSADGFRPGDVGSKFLPLHAPRLSIGLQGTLDGGLDFLESARAMYENARPFYAADGVPENLVLVVEACGHTFTDSFKRRAFDTLKAYFGL